MKKREENEDSSDPHSAHHKNRASQALRILATESKPPQQQAQPD